MLCMYCHGLFCSLLTPGAVTHAHHLWHDSTPPTFNLGLFSPCFCGSLVLANKLKLRDHFYGLNQSRKQNFKSPLLSLPHHLRRLSLLVLMRDREIWRPVDFPKWEMTSQWFRISFSSEAALVPSRVTLAIRFQCSMNSDSKFPFQHFITLYEHNHLFYSSNILFIKQIYMKFMQFLDFFSPCDNKTSQGTMMFWETILVLANEASSLFEKSCSSSCIGMNWL